VSIAGLTSWGSSAAAISSSAPTIQIAIRASQSETVGAAGQAACAASVTSVGSAPLQLRVQPERMILAAVTSAADGIPIYL